MSHVGNTPVALSQLPAPDARPVPGTPAVDLNAPEPRSMDRMRIPAAVSMACLLTTSSIVDARAQDAAPEAPEAPVTREEVQSLLDGFSEQIGAMQADLDRLKKLKFSGYVQARIEFGEASSDSVRVTGASATSAGTFASPNVSRFFIRRGRLKLAYESSPLSRAVVYFDGGTDRTVRLLEGYVTLLDPWTPLHDHQLTMGQFGVPFGYEIERSSSVRELPERSRAENVLFAGERDRGVRLDSRWTLNFSTSFALLNGAGINSTDFPTTDPTRAKDFVGRARWSQGTWDVAASCYLGHQTTPLTGDDLETDKTRFGLDAQVYYTAPRLGGGSLRAEAFAGQDVNADSLKVLVGAAGGARLLVPGRDPGHLATNVRGGYVMLVQNVGERAQVAVRYDGWDPDTNVGHDGYGRFSAGVNAFYDGFTRVTLAYDAISTDVATGAGQYRDPNDNLWTLQLQHKF